MIFEFFLFLSIGLTLAITTITHNKPGSVTVSAIELPISVTDTEQHHENNNFTKISISREENVTILNLLDRKKRLLPYQNFYFNQPFNRPHKAGVSAQQYKDFPVIRKLPKNPHIDHSSQQQHQHHQFAENAYSSGQRFITPFSEHNALPGAFRPMTFVGNPDEEQYTSLERNPEDNNENRNKNYQSEDFSAIYDKLAQLKLRQQTMHRFNSPYEYKLVPQQHHLQFGFRERPTTKNQIHFRPNNNNNNNNNEVYQNNYKINPSKTTIETFTATNIDIPQKYGEIRPTATIIREPQIRYYNNHHSIKNEAPSASGSIRSNNNNNNNNYRPTYVLIQPASPKLRFRPSSKPKTVNEENYEAEKYVPVVYKKPHQQNHHQYYHHHHHHHHQEPQHHVVYVRPDDDGQIYQPSNNYEKDSSDEENQSYESNDSKINEQHQGYAVTETPTSPQQQSNLLEYDNNNNNAYYRYQTITPSSNPTTFAPIQSFTPILTTVENKPEEERIRDSEYLAVTSQEKPMVNPKEQGRNSLADLLKQLQETNTLPQTLTADNIDNSIKTLVKILNALKDRQKQHKPVVVQNNDYEYENEAGVDYSGEIKNSPAGGTPGQSGVDYPALSNIPKTAFSCKSQRYKGFFGDPDTNCQVWHYCDLNGGQASFLCPNGTIFSQVALTCDWWYNVKCASTAQLYVLNERLYKYIIPLSPKFPEDYSGPLVDKYLAMKFQEMEEKLQKQKKGKGNSDTKSEEEAEEEEKNKSTETEEDDDENVSEEKNAQVVEETYTAVDKIDETTTESVTDNP